MRDLKIGDKGTDVFFAQKLYNRFAIEHSFKNYLDQDGDFGNNTKKGMQEFQSWYRSRFGGSLPTDGSVNAAMWNALGATHGVSHSVKLVPQYNEYTCWEACINMLLGKNQCHEMPKDFLGSNRLLLDDSSAVHHFASMVRRQAMRPPTDPNALRLLLAVKPIVILGRSPRLPGGGHAVVVSAIWSAQSGDPFYSVLRVLNPWPANRGRVEPSGYPLMDVQSDSFEPVWVIA